ncbi:MAG: hypothetical protein H0U27_13250 [Nitrosopumilus sp.]|nr:hypothetical protein [Nitrosopumilus sp.]
MNTNSLPSFQPNIPTNISPPSANRTSNTTTTSEDKTSEGIANQLPSSTQVKDEINRGPKGNVPNDFSSSKQYAKIGAGATLAVTAGILSVATAPFLLIGAGVGATLRYLKSNETGVETSDKKMIVNGAIAGSLGILAAAKYGKNLMKEGSSQIKYNEYETKYNDYKTKVNDLKEEVKTKEANELTARHDINYSYTELVKLRKEIKTQKTELKELKLLNPKKLDAIDKISKQVLAKHSTLSAEDKQAIQKAVFNLKKETVAVKIDLGDKGFFVISKGSLGGDDPKVIEIAKRTDNFAEGGFGKLYNLKYIHTGGSNIESKVMKMANDKEGSIQDIKNEVKNLDEIGGSEGIQAKSIVNLNGLYIIDKAKGDLRLFKKKTSISLFSKDFNKMSIAKKQVLTKSLLTASSNFKENFYHGDIKPGNILVEKDADGKTKLVFADWGGARKFEDIFHQSEDDLNYSVSVGNLLGANTRTFVSEKIKKEMYKLQSESDRKTGEITDDFYSKNPKTFPSDTKENKFKTEGFITAINLTKEICSEYNEKVKALLKQNDDFAIGMTLYYIWIGNLPIFSGRGEDGNSSINEKQMEDVKAQLTKNKVPQTDIDEIVKLLTPGMEG